MPILHSIQFRAMNNAVLSFRRYAYRFICIGLMLSFMLCNCKKDDELHKTSLLLKTGVAYTSNGSAVKLGGVIRIGVMASGAGAPLTYLRIEKISGNDTVIQVDKGIFIESEGLNEDFTFSKDTASKEMWHIMVMNSDRDTASVVLTINKAAGSAWRPIKYFENIELSFQDHPSKKWYLDADEGIIYDQTSVNQHEKEIDIMVTITLLRESSPLH